MIQSRLPVSKKEGKGKKKHQLARQKQEGKKGELYLPLNEPLSFLSPSCDFPSLFPPSLFHLYPKSFSFSFLSFFFLSLIILSPSVSLRHVFQGLPSIDTVSTNSSPPVPSGEPLGKVESWGRASRGRLAGYRVIRVSWRGGHGHKPSYLITAAAQKSGT